MSISDAKLDFKKLLERLHDPLQLRVLITGLVLLIGYVAVYMPFNGRIEEATRKHTKEQKRNSLANEIEDLRARVESFQPRLPKDTDTNEWIQYVLGGVRRYPLKLAFLDSDAPQRVGPYQAVVLHLELEGTFRDLDAFLHWLESNERLFRVDSAKIAQPRGNSDKLTMQLTVLGLMG